MLREMSSRKVKLASFSNAVSSRYFSRWRKLPAKVLDTRENHYFSQTNFAFA